MTIIATAVGSAIASTTIGASLTAGLASTFGISSALATGIVGGTAIAGVGGAIGGMAADAAGQEDAMKRQDQQTAAQNAAAAAAPASATNLYSTPTAPISQGGQQYFATGGITALAKGGQSVNLGNADYIIPADVVSALGNGSTKAGARYLQEQFARLNRIEGVGALPESKKLMATRMKKQKKA